MSKNDFNRKLTLAEAKFKFDRPDIHKTRALGKHLQQEINKEKDNPNQTGDSLSNAKMFRRATILQSDDIYYRNRSYDFNQQNFLSIANSDNSKDQSFDNDDGNTHLTKENEAKILEIAPLHTNGNYCSMVKTYVPDHNKKCVKNIGDKEQANQFSKVNYLNKNMKKGPENTNKVQKNYNTRNLCLKKIEQLNKGKAKYNVSIKGGKHPENND